MVIKLIKRAVQKHNERILRMNGFIRCAHCGKFIDKSDKYCSYCGNKSFLATSQATSKRS